MRTLKSKTFATDPNAKAGRNEFAELTAFAKKLDGIERLQNGMVHITGKLKQELFNLDDEKLKPYFQLRKY
jgi:peptidyl-dipeptidase Dcp